jgi:hypothetical protein
MGRSEMQEQWSNGRAARRGPVQVPYSADQPECYSSSGCLAERRCAYQAGSFNAALALTDGSRFSPSANDAQTIHGRLAPR